MVIDGESLIVHLQHVPVPTRIPGDAVIMANSGRHRSATVREAIKAAGVLLLGLPPCSPDFNPIENAFPKLRAPLRKVAARSRDAVRDALGTALDAVKPDGCRNHSTAAGCKPR